MAKGTGLIGNFKGKVGNTVGYKLSASNNGQTQGIRVYQPIVKNPKTAAQAEQRAKLLAVNANYRALKMVIDRGNEGLPYGNKSRLAWLKGALKATNMPWIEKGMVVNAPVGTLLTKGSLPGIQYTGSDSEVIIIAPGLTQGHSLTTIGGVSTALMSVYPWLKKGDQITIVFASGNSNALNATVNSFIIDTTSAVATSGWTEGTDALNVKGPDGCIAEAIIVSREGDNGEHLRSTAELKVWHDALAIAPYDAASKAAAIASYQSSAATNSDWAEESIQ